MKISKELYNELSELDVAKLSKEGKEILNPEPIVADVTPRPLTISEQIKRLMRVHLSQEAADQGYETFDEADDFDVEEDFDDSEPISGYEMTEERIVRPKKAAAKVEPKGQPEEAASPTVSPSVPPTVSPSVPPTHSTNT